MGNIFKDSVTENKSKKLDGSKIKEKFDIFKK